MHRALDAAGLTATSLAALAAPDARASEAPLREAARALGVPVLPVTPAALAAVDARLPTRSPRALAAYGVGSVAEAAALAASGAERLALTRLASPSATCALAIRARARHPAPAPRTEP